MSQVGKEGDKTAWNGGTSQFLAVLIDHYCKPATLLHTGTHSSGRMYGGFQPGFHTFHTPLIDCRIAFRSIAVGRERLDDALVRVHGVESGVLSMKCGG